MKAVTVNDIVVKYLTDNGYDGLYNDDCGCVITDLCPCFELSPDCHAGHKIPCPDGSCGEHDFHIGPRQEEKA
jgi:hypothetical protein